MHLSLPARLLFATLTASTLGGCALLAPWQSERQTTAPLAVPAAWSAAGTTTAAASATPEALATWWRQLDDPTLSSLVERALQAAPDLRSAQARLRQARAARDLAQAEFFPTVTGSVGASRTRSSPAVSGSTAAPRTLHDAGFDASWEPDLFGGTRKGLAASEADLAASAATLDSTRVSLAAEVAVNYLDLRSAQQRLAIAQANAASQEETLAITRWRAQAGLATTLDVEQANTNLEQTRATLPSLEVSRAQAEHRLAVLLGQAPGSLRSELAAVRPLPTAPDSIALDIPADTLRRRPDVRAAELTVTAESARLGQQQAARYPSLTLSGSFGWQAFSLAALGGSDTIARAVGGTLAATLFDGGRIRARIDAQDAVQEQAVIAYEKAVLTALEDVENALAAYARGRERIASRRLAAESARNAAQLARQLYQAGLADFQKVLDTERTRLTAEDNLASAEADVLTAVVQLYKALGGGWNSAASAHNAS